MRYKYKVMFGGETEDRNDEAIDNSSISFYKASLLVHNSKLCAKYGKGCYIVEAVDENNKKRTFEIFPSYGHDGTTGHEV